MTAPILVHTAEEVWDHVEHPDEAGGKRPSVPLARAARRSGSTRSCTSAGRGCWPCGTTSLRAVERLREEKSVAQTMDVSLTLGAATDELRALLLGHRDDLIELLMVSELRVLEAAPSEQDAPRR